MRSIIFSLTCILFMFYSSASAQTINSIFKSQGKDDIFGFGEGVLFRADTISNDEMGGTVTRYFPSGDKYEEVNYSNVKKGEFQGKQTRWFDNGQIQVSQEYSAGKRHGLLVTYYPSGKIRRQEEYQNGVSVKGKCFTADGKLASCADYVIFPEYPGGSAKLLGKLQSNIEFPREVIRQNIEGQVFVSFIIDKTGAVKNAFISKSLATSLDNEAMRAVNKLRGWKPGKLDGEVVETLFTLPVTFAIR